MQKNKKQNLKDFDIEFDNGDVEIDFSEGIVNEGLSTTVKLPPISIPTWLAAEIESLSKLQANSKASIVRQLLVEAIKNKRAD
ncbi:MAG: hypothetical protein H6622_03785 [Halobacteriovoraceae bacterium]|nr:hypothetical protein [Halobacteriovoraceae bacterium]